MQELSLVVNQVADAEGLSSALRWVGVQMEPVARLLLAAVLGAALGAEREWRQRTAGFRTNTLIGLGSALFTLVSIHMAEVGGGDPTRIPSQIVTGIGFLGGGAILRNQGDVRGVTTAATIWVNAAIGMAAGAGFYTIAITSTIATLIVLIAFVRIERYLSPDTGASTPVPIVGSDESQPKS